MLRRMLSARTERLEVQEDAMTGSAVLVPVEEYLTTSYEPDVDYVDGELQERNLGEEEHATIQKFFVGFLLPREGQWKIRTM